MKEDWKECRLGDVVEIHRGASPRPIQKFIVTSGMPWVKISDATANNSRFIDSTKEFIIEEGISKSVIVNPEDLIVSNSATPGLPKIMKIKACIHDGWLYFENYKNITRDFLYYKFFDIQKRLTNLANGSVFQNLKTDIVRDFIINLPPLSTQQKIAAVLSSLDDKIELNNRINQNLEQQAQAIFKSWFVDFEPFGGKMPEGWRMGKLGDFVEIKRGGSPRPIQNFLSDEGYRWLKISDVTSLSAPFVLNIAEHIKEEGLSKTVFLKTGSLVLSNSATPGIPKILDLDTCIHDGWLYFPKSQLSNEYLYLLFKEIRPQLINLGNGSIFTNLKTDILRNYEVTLPNKETLSNFQNIIKPIFEKMLFIQRETKQLEIIRDTLLPKLMSGEIDVESVTI